MNKKGINNIIVLSGIVLMLFVAFFSLTVLETRSSITERDNAISGFAVHPLYSGFSAVNSGFAFDNSSDLLSVNDSIVYKIAYYSINGSAWQSFLLVGEQYNFNSNWLRGGASTVLPAFGFGEHYIIIFSCAYFNSNNSWNCYDNKWQLFVLNNSDSSSCSGNSTQSCSITNGAGTQSRTCVLGNWSSWSACTVTSCNTNYVISGNSCVYNGTNTTTIWTGELMTNGGFESGSLTGWTAVGTGGWAAGYAPNAVLYGAGGVGPQAGSYCAFQDGTTDTSSSASGYIYQDVNLTAYASYIDAGGVVVNASGWGVGAENCQCDMTRIQIMFLNSSKGVISTPLNTGYSQNLTWWKAGIYTRAVPAGTRYIRMWGNSYEAGGWDGGSLDSFSVKIAYGGAPCTDTCSSLGYVCGTQSVCGGSVNCGSCGTGYNCVSGGCVACTDTCSSLGYACGNQSVCGSTVNCGSCGSGYTCTAGSCVAACTDTCSSLGYVCGTQSVCGGSVNCGSCGTGYNCVSGGCVACTDTCSSLGYTCGTQTVCGSSVNCGSCGTNYTCTAGSCVASTGTIYYISTSGTDSASRAGSSSAPWRTLSYACSRVTTAGSVIHVNAGTYSETTACALAPGVSIEGEGATSRITTSSLTADVGYGDPIINVVSASNTNGNQEIRYLYFDGNSLTGGHAIHIENRNNVLVHHNTFINFNYVAVAWDASGTSEASPPSAFVTGGQFYSNNVTNCAGYAGGWYRGALLCGGLRGMRIYNNTMIENARTAGNHGWPIKFWYWGGWMIDTKIYDNYLERGGYSTLFDFAIESCFESGLEIYNNTIIGSIDLNDQIQGYGYDYSVWIHDNILGPATHITSSTSLAGITLEFDNTDVIIERNTFRHVSPAVVFTPRTDTQDNIVIRYNVMNNVWADGWYQSAIVMNSPSGVNINGFYVYNNVFYGAPTATLTSALQLSSNGGSYSGTNVQFVNNIVSNFDTAPVTLTSAGSLNGLNIENNLVYNSGNNNAPSLTGTPANYVYQNNRLGVDPLFVNIASGNFRLQSTSTAINNGKNVGLTTDFVKNSVPYGSAPDIGAYEYR